ncbi:hypothetical protein KAFR_0G01080 [Kazachstania africana CBS 2517]|uniref:Protein kinase C-like 1 n=1 Tax=Kazachstania africana (strain ATCC 22294 / BCRC 22015 / CBS 2517 / CECT 1963 / NBRC 1671 / NRRL Y-8276) TaxID=1071382 RepID=H2AXP1_KAZAF|nr:hypothetical protein KAFR_0G01080 [Kazachstania africana CBS 2517]CCF59141.1 hypothetical protein KAFR_0G01080 [Kazachstania africana CBS 2517]
MLSHLEEDINRKIAVEQNIIQGATNLKKKTDNSMVIQKCNTNIREARQNIEYLHETLRKLRVSDQPNDEIPKDKPKEYGYLSTISPNEHMFSRLDLVKYDCPSLSQRIQYMLQQLEFKLQVEKQYQEANAKLTKLYQIDGDARSSSAAQGGAFESKHRIIMLKRALKKYQAINVDLDQYKHHDQEFLNHAQPKFRRKPLTGVLNIGITAIRDVDHIQSPMFAKSPETFITFKIDDTIKAQSKLSRNDRWNDEFQIQVSKGNEVEITVYDKVNDVVTPVAIMWLLLSDIVEEIRKKKASQTNGEQRWVSASNIVSTESARSSHDHLNNDNRMFTAETSGITDPATQANMGNQITTSQWFVLEPAGQILLNLGFYKTSQPQRKHVMGGLHRHGAIINRKEEIFEQHGHHFVQKSFYNIMCCAYCGDFLRYSGFQCQDCKFLCHKKCYTNVVTKCIAKTSNDVDPNEAKLNHRIPHRFEPSSNRGTKWCCHCGYILPWGKQKVRKCSECGIMCHAQCAHLVPDFCGMSMEMANRILKTIQDAKRTQEQKRRLPPSSRTASTHAKGLNASPNKSVNESRHSVFLEGNEKEDQHITSEFSETPLNFISKQEQSRPDDKPQNRVGATDRLNDYIGENEAYLNFTNNAQNNEGSDQSSAFTRTLDPSINDGEPNTMVSELGHDDEEYKQNLYNEKSRLWEKQRNEMEIELENERKQIQQYAEENLERELKYRGKISLETREEYEELLVPDGYEAGNVTVETTHSNPFRDMNERTFQMEQQNLVQEAIEKVTTSPHKDTPLPNEEEVYLQKTAIKHKKKSSKRRKVSLDNFILLKVLGKGNFGKVILSKSKNTGRLCAIKVLKKDNIIQNHDIESARAEKKVLLLATKTKHPFLTNLYCSFQTENRIYFAMEFIGGGDLMWHVQNQRLSVRRAKFYAAEVLLALKYFHDNGVIYRDLKLENILLTPQGHIKIADYGLCKDEMWYGNKTSTFCGTPEFMAPEILKDQEYTRAVDWWAFGVLLYQMLLCQSPFSGDDEDEVFNAILTDEPLYPIDMAGDIVQIFQGLLTKDPQSRLGGGPRDALEVMEEPFFHNINFDDILHLRVQPPYIPDIKSAEDTSYFEQEFTSAPPTLTPLPSVLTTSQQEEFRGFSFMPEDLEL